MSLLLSLVEPQWGDVLEKIIPRAGPRIKFMKNLKELLAIEKSLDSNYNVDIVSVVYTAWGTLRQTLMYIFSRLKSTGNPMKTSSHFVRPDSVGLGSTILTNLSWMGDKSGSFGITNLFSTLTLFLRKLIS